MDSSVLDHTSDTVLRPALIAALFESIFYGLFVCMWVAAVCLHIAYTHDKHGRVMLAVSSFMMAFATTHVGISFDSLLDCLVSDSGRSPATCDFDPVSPGWRYIAKNMIFMAQEFAGAAVAIYRLWLVWSKSRRVIAGPCVLLVITASVGIVGFSHSVPYHIERAFRLTFYILVVVQNALSTGMVCFHVWSVHKCAAPYLSDSGSHRPDSVMGLLRIFIESSALQIVAELIMLILYVSQSSNTQDSSRSDGAMQAVTPLVGITFCIIAFRLRLPTTTVQKVKEPLVLAPTHVEPILIHVTTRCETDAENCT